MEIIIKSYGDDGDIKSKKDLADYVCQRVDQTLNSGAVESLEEKTNTLIESFGKLLSILADKNVLSEDDVNKIVGRYGHKICFVK